MAERLAIGKHLKEKAAVEAAQARLDAERAAFELQQAQGGLGLDRVEQARAASAAIEDPELRKRHQDLVRVAAVGMEMLVAAPDAGPAGVGQRLAGAAATVVADTRKVSRDMVQRRRQEERQRAGAQRSAARDEAWMERYGQHQGQPQGQQRASRRHANAARQVRRERSDRRAILRVLRGGGGSGAAKTSPAAPSSDQ